MKGVLATGLHACSEERLKVMKLSILAAAVAAGVAGCAPYTERPAKAARSQGPRDRYETEILKSSLASSKGYQAWVAEGRRALRDGLSIRPSFKEVVHFAADDPTAVGYRLELSRGQRLRVQLTRSRGTHVFAELFEQIGATDPVFRLVHSAHPRANEFSFEAKTDGVHVLRLQPELMKGGEVAITVTTAAGLTFPVFGKNSKAIKSFFGDARDGGRRDHEGIDIFAARGTAVLAVADGIITDVGNNKLGGKVVWQHDAERDVTYYYAHLNSQSVQQGDRVSAGTTIGTVGNTGNARTTPPHLHFAVYRPGRVAINPVPFIYDAPADVIAPVLVDLTRLGDWTQTEKPTTLHASPARTARVLAQVPANTKVRVVSGVREWHRVELEDGRRGFMPGQVRMLGVIAD
jgi:murein DD-endopeptidase MepM/ murein hydrolase activator NlpD